MCSRINDCIQEYANRPNSYKKLSVIQLILQEATSALLTNE